MGQTHHVRVQGINSTQAKSVFRDHDTGLGIYRHWFTCPTKKKNLQHSNMQKARKWIYRKIRLLRNTPKTIHFIPVIHAYHIQLVICNRIQAIATFFPFLYFFFQAIATLLSDSQENYGRLHLCFTQRSVIICTSLKNPNI